MKHRSERMSSLPILWNREVNPGYFRMGIEHRQAFQEAVPGQFVMVRVPKRQLPLLRRPFSIHDIISSHGRVSGFEILYKVIGEGTENLAMCQAGDTVDVLGPLGSGFATASQRGRIYLAAGGIGVAPFVFLSRRLVQEGVSGSDITLFLGGRSKRDLLCLATFEKLGVQLNLSTDDGSAGRQCVVTEPLMEAIEKKPPDILYACGPETMLRKIILFSQAFNLKCQVSIETMMACGMGACLGCAVVQRDSKQVYLHACIDGPVFDAGSIVL